MFSFLVDGQKHQVMFLDWIKRPCRGGRVGAASSSWLPSAWCAAAAVTPPGSRPPLDLTMVEATALLGSFPFPTRCRSKRKRLYGVLQGSSLFARPAAMPAPNQKSSRYPPQQASRRLPRLGRLSRGIDAECIPFGRDDVWVSCNPTTGYTRPAPPPQPHPGAGRRESSLAGRQVAPPRLQ